MAIECQILLVPTKEGIYRSGHPVIGTLRFRLDTRTTFTSVILQLDGKGKCSWSESGDDSTTFYSGKETYASMKKIILQPPQTYLEKGVHEYPFEFYIPQDIPSSFKDKVCTIAYRVVAEFKKSGLFGDKKFETEIPVYGYLEPCSAEPIIFGLTKSPFSSNSAIDVKINAEKTFLMPGENIKLRCTVVNKTSVPVTGIKTRLITDLTYISDNNEKEKRRKPIKDTVVESIGCDAYSKTDFIYVVPTLPNLYSIQHTKIFIKEYKLQVTAKLPFPHRDASVEIPVVIGERRPTLNNTFNNEQQHFDAKLPIGFVNV